MKKSICFYFLIFFVSLCTFASLLPYPILSRYTNSTEKQMSMANNFKETEIADQQNEINGILDITWSEGIDNLIELEQTYELYDFTTKQTFSIKRIGGKNHADIVPASQADFDFITQNLTKNNNPVALIFNSNLVIPASLSAYMHGYSDKNNEFYGHYCLHFKSSTMHSSDSSDYYHQKAIKTARKNATAVFND